jgi:hypothetical protein
MRHRSSLFPILIAIFSIALFSFVGNVNASPGGANTDKILNAIHQVESGGATANVPNGDNGKAIGPFQIHKAYWMDAGIPGQYTDCHDYAYSKRVVLAYMKRYCPEALASGDAETIARVHNGGPTGASRKTTLSYWAKVQKHL